MDNASRPGIRATLTPVTNGVTTAAPAFIGRDHELADLEGALAEAADSRHGVVTTIGGEPGIGKTRLVQELTARAADRGVAVSWSSCWEGSTPALHMWRQTLERVIDAEPSALEQLGDRREAEVRRLLSDGMDVDPNPSTVAADAARHEFFDAIARLLERVARRAPLLLVFEDVHWADEASLELLSYVVSAIAAAPVLIVATYRDLEGGRALRATLDALPGSARQFVLGGLDPGETTELVASLTKQSIAPEVGDALARQTNGNPLFVREVVQLLRAQNRLDTTTASIPLPDTVLSVISRRLARLSSPCHDLLATAAVVGPEFTLEVLVRTCAYDREVVLRLVDEALAARLVAAVPNSVRRYTFVHALVRQALYDGLALDDRYRRHQRVGAALEDESADVAELAHHAVHAAPLGDASMAVALAAQAGDEALRQLAYEKAADHYRDAIDVGQLAVDSAPGRAELFLRLGDAQVRAGDLTGSAASFLTAAEAARHTGDGERLARAALGLGTGMSGFEIALGDQAQIDLLEESLRTLHERDSSLRARVTARLSVALTGVADEERRRGLAEEAMALARAADDERARAYALAAHCDLIAGPDHVQQRTEQGREIVAIAGHTGDREMELLGRRLLVVALLEQGDVAGVDAEIDAFARVAATLRQPLYQWYVPLWRGMRALMRGDIEQAVQLRHEAEAIGQAANSTNARMLTMTQRTDRFFLLGEDRESLVELLTMIEQHPEIPNTEGPRAWALVGLGREREGRSLLDVLVEGGLARFPNDAEWLTGLAGFADAAARLRHRQLAEPLYVELLPFEGRFIVDGIGAATLGAVDWHLGRLAALLGRRDDASRHFDAALAAHRRVGAGLLVETVERDRAALLGAQPAEATPAAEQETVFRRDGDVWTLVYDGTTARLKDAKGLRDLGALLACPGEMIHVGELVGSAEGAPAQPRLGGDAVLDRRAVDEYRHRLRELEEETEDADAAHDLERSTRARAERDAIVDELEAALGLGGRSRRLGDETEKARKAVRARIRLVLDRLEQQHPPLARHLRSSVRTGTFCSYEPERPVEWSL